MSIEANYFERTLRGAEQQALLDGENMLLADVYGILTPEAVAAGVQIDFGSDREGFGKVLEALRLEVTLQSDAEVLHMHNVVVLTPGHESMVGKAIPVLEDLPLLDALDALQADRWHSYKLHDIYPKVQVTDGFITSQIVIANSAKRDGQKIADVTKPAVIVGVRYRYLPDFQRDAFDTELASYLDEIDANNSGLDTRVGKIAMRMVERGQDLRMPTASYFLRVGAMAGNLLGSIVDVHTRFPANFVLQDGRIITTLEQE